MCVTVWWVLHSDLSKNTTHKVPEHDTSYSISGGGENFDKTVTICVSICHYQIAEKNYEQIESHCICICQFQGWAKNREQNNVISALSMQSQNMDRE